MKNYIIKLLIDNLENYKDYDVYGCDMSYTLLERYNIDGSITYSTHNAKMWIQKYFDEVGEMLEEMQYNYGDDAMVNIYKNLWENPEVFMLSIVLEKASELMGQLDFISDNWNDKITLNEENIEIIKEQLKKEME